MTLDKKTRELLAQASEILMVTVGDVGVSDATIVLPGSSTATQKRYKYAVAGMQLTSGGVAYALKIADTYVLLGGTVSGGGEPGATFTPSVSVDGVISWTNNGGLPNPTPVNIKGPKGDGEPGATFTPSVSVDGVISWTNNGGLPNPTPVNIKGPKGDGMYAFEIRVDGHLWCVYETATAPAFSINAAGHLIYDLGGS